LRLHQSLAIARATAAFLQRSSRIRVWGEKKSTLKIRVKWRLNICWHRPLREFPEREAPVLSLTGHKDEANA
jgi:hypothetical protein